MPTHLRLALVPEDSAATCCGWLHCDLLCKLISELSFNKVQKTLAPLTLTTYIVVTKQGDSMTLTTAQADLLNRINAQQANYRKNRWSWKGYTPRGNDIHSARAMVRKGVLVAIDRDTFEAA